MRQVLMSALGAALVAVVSSSPTPSFAAAKEDPGAHADEPRSRVSFLEGKLERRATGEIEAEEIGLNAILGEGDELSTGAGSFVELEFAHGTFVRMAGGTRIVLEQIKDRVFIGLTQGAVYMSRGPDANPGSIVTGAGRAALDVTSMVRVDADAQGFAVRVAVGRSEVLMSEATKLVEANQSLHFAGTVRETAWPATDRDAFDKWNAKREKKVRSYERPKQISGEYEGLYDLEGHGEWVFVGGRWCWKPAVSDEWRPYWDGYWAWRAQYGWVWVSHESWGYVTHHYGRWLYTYRYGWVWIPGVVWSPAWVAWSTYGGYVGWCPVDFYGRPIIVYARYGYYDPWAWSWCYPDYLYYGGGYYYDHGYYYDDHHGHPRDTPRAGGGSHREGGSGTPGSSAPIFTVKNFDLGNPAKVPDSVQQLAPNSSIAAGKQPRGTITVKPTDPVTGTTTLADLVRTGRKDSKRPVMPAKAELGPLPPARLITGQPRVQPRVQPPVRSPVQPVQPRVQPTPHAAQPSDPAVERRVKVPRPAATPETRRYEPAPRSTPEPRRYEPAPQSTPEPRRHEPAPRSTPKSSGSTYSPKSSGSSGSSGTSSGSKGSTKSSGSKSSGSKSSGSKSSGSKSSGSKTKSESNDSKSSGSKGGSKSWKKKK